MKNIELSRRSKRLKWPKIYYLNLVKQNKTTFLKYSSVSALTLRSAFLPAEIQGYL